MPDKKVSLLLSFRKNEELTDWNVVFVRIYHPYLSMSTSCCDSGVGHHNSTLSMKVSSWRESAPFRAECFETHAFRS